MIVFDLRCGNGHVFEAWFGSSAAFEEQKAGGLVVCPTCGDEHVEKAVMAPNVATKGNRKADAPVPGRQQAKPSPDAVKTAMKALAEAQNKALEGSEWVGMAFEKRARAMHDGEEDTAPIHGQATVEQAKALIEDGVSVAPLPFPVLPPNSRN
ncbi:DUF1178 family protein [Stakelama marina]|uniref:DUF1178 family protein n=1 Tax=Stakelama marina TaxID=2826939 RepID=A0A8T4IAE8_9SPHN|nr:DUF1178 family protein [Stakelama marina]MBR0551998.1 DUF1178 family protein [Stakelama marina]